MPSELVGEQDGTDLRDYRADETTGEEKAAWWARVVAMWPDYDAYQASTDREIPLFVLTPDTEQG